VKEWLQTGLPLCDSGKNVDNNVKITTIFLNVFLSTIIIFIPARLLRPWERPGSKVKEWLQLQPRSGPR
jgi:hypothetical protein